MANRYFLFVINVIFVLIIPNAWNKTIQIKLTVNEAESKIVLTTTEFDLRALKDRFKENPYKVTTNTKEIYYENIENENYEGIITSLTLTWNHSVIDCSYMFYNLTSITSIDLRNFDFSVVNNTEKMFAGCQNLKAITFPKKAFKLSIIDMNHMFYDCYTLDTLTNFAKLEFSSVKNISAMFYNCRSFKSLTISNIKTENVLNASYMFYSCSSFGSLDSQNLIMPNVLDISYMFYNCANLKILNLLNINSSNIIKIDSIFEKCNALTSLDLSNFNFVRISLSNKLFEGLSKLQILRLSNT